MAGPLPFFSRRPLALFQRWVHRNSVPNAVDAEGQPGGHPWATSRGTMQSEGNRVEVFVDGHDAFAAASAAVSGARRSLRLLQMSFETDFVAAFRDGVSPPLAEVVREAGARGVDVRLLLSKIEPVDLLAYAETSRFFEGRSNVQVRPFPLRAQLQHAKLMVVDGEAAFLFGPLFVQAYWDLPTHPIIEHRRGEGITAVGDRPVHDLAVRVEGPAVADVDRCFADLWNHRADAEGRPHERVEPCDVPPPRGNQALQVVRTLPRNLLSDRLDGETDAYEAYLRGIRNAERFVYIENQYFTSRELAAALRAAVDRSPSLQVILVLNPRLDIPLYLRRQCVLLDGVLKHPRIGAFSLWAFDATPPRPVVQRVYVHSKTAVIDDEWAALGTANLDGFSLHGATEVGMPENRNVETNVILFDGLAGKPATGLVGGLRRRLWAEHLGSRPNVREPPNDGWLSLWQAVAMENVGALSAGRPPTSMVLPYAVSTRRGGDAKALQSLGIDARSLDLRS